MWSWVNVFYEEICPGYLADFTVNILTVSYYLAVGLNFYPCLPRLMSADYKWFGEWVPATGVRAFFIKEHCASSSKTSPPCVKLAICSLQEFYKLLITSFLVTPSSRTVHTSDENKVGHKSLDGVTTSGQRQWAILTPKSLPERPRLLSGQYHSSAPSTHLCSLLTLPRDSFLINISHFTLCLSLLPPIQGNALYSFISSGRHLIHKLSAGLGQFPVLYADNVATGGIRKCKKMVNLRW